MSPADILAAILNILGFLCVLLLAVTVIGFVVACIRVVWMGTQFDGSPGTPYPVRRLAKLFDVGLPQTCITVKDRHVEALVAEGERRGFHLHDRAGDLLIFRKAKAFQPR